MAKIKQVWVKKLFGSRVWNTLYSHNKPYCFLKKEIKGVWAGFVVGNTIPRDCTELTNEEIVQVDDYRRANHIYPSPTIKPEPKTIKCQPTPLF